MKTHKMIADRNERNAAQMAAKDLITNSDKHYFMCDEGATFTTVTDTINNVTFDNTVEPTIIMSAAADPVNSVRMGVDNNDNGTSDANNDPAKGGWLQPGDKDVMLTVMFRVVADPADVNNRGLMSFDFGQRSQVESGSVNDGRLLVSRTEATFTSRPASNITISGELHTSIVFDDDDWTNWYYPDEGDIVIVTVIKRENRLDYYRNGRYISKSPDVSERDPRLATPWNNWQPSQFRAHMTHTEGKRRRPWAQSDGNGNQRECQLFGTALAPFKWVGTAADELDVALALGRSRLRDGSNESMSGLTGTDWPVDTNCYRDQDGTTPNSTNRITDEYPQDWYGIHVASYVRNSAPGHDVITRMQEWNLNEWVNGNKSLSPELVSFK